MNATAPALVLAAALLLHGAPALVQTAALSGALVAGDTRAPIPRAVVTLAGAALERSLVAVTDGDGRFAFDALPPGQFTLTASKPTYLSMAYGQQTPGRGRGLPITLATGQRVGDLTWALPKGAAISGRVLDDGGLPFADIQVVLMQRVARPGEDPQLERASCCSARTDGQGVYRLFGVPPGNYLVAALPHGDYVYMPEPWTTNPPAVRETTDAEVAWATRRLAGAPLPDPAPARQVTYTRVFYGGTSQPEGATALALAAGDQRAGIDIHMRLLPSARIEGRAIAPDGSVMRRVRVSMSGAGWGPVDSIVSRNLTPGRYSITVRDQGATLWGRADVDLAGEDITDLEIRLAPAARIEGRIVFEPAAAAPPADLSSVRVTLRPTPGIWSAARVLPDGAFTLSGMDPGRYLLTAALPAARGAPPSPWVLKSAIAGGRNLTDEPFAIAAGEQISEVLVTFTDRTTDLSGTLFDAADRPAPGFYVVVIPRDERFRTPGSRRMPAPARAATDGTFRFAGLPPGEYVLAAATSAEPDELADTAWLRQLAAAGIDVALAEGEKKTQHVRFVR